MVGIVSDQTLCEMAERLTGVPFEEELKRLKKQSGSGVFDSDKETDTEVEEDEQKDDEAST